MGVIVDLGGTYLLGTVLVIVYAAFNATPEMSSSEMQLLGEEFGRTVAAFDNGWSWAALALGFSCSFLGGYVCAAKARETRVKALAILALIMALFGLQTSGDLQLGVNLLLALLTAAAVIAGGRTWAARQLGSSASGGTGE